MSVSDLKNFIKNISVFSDLPLSDQSLIDQIQSKIDEINTSTIAARDSDLHDFIKNIFRSRRESVINTEFDYLKSYSESTKCWIEFAKILGHSIGESHIDIIMPGIPNINGLEHFSGSPLSDFDDLTRLMAADDGTLYSTNHMFEDQRENHQFYLLVSGTDVKRPWSLTEIDTYGKHKTYQVQTTEQTYQSFWHYLVSTSFLRPYAKMELDDVKTGLYKELISKLGHLIDTFYLDNDKLKQFRIVLHEFSQELKGYPVDVVNKFYSQRVNRYDDHYSPLMELLLLGFNEKREGLISEIEAIERHFSAEFKCQKLNRALSIDTVLTILNFIEPVLVNDGSPKYENRMFKAVYAAGDMLEEFNESIYPEIPETEKEKLEHYPILKRHSMTNEDLCYCFKGIYEHSLKGNIGLTYSYFVKLVLDFIPWYQFPEVFTKTGKVEHIKRTLRIKSFQEGDDLGEKLKFPLIESIRRLNEQQILPFMKQILACPQTTEAFNALTSVEKASISKHLESLIKQAYSAGLIPEDEVAPIAHHWEEHTCIAVTIFDEHLATKSM